MRERNEFEAAATETFTTEEGVGYSDRLTRRDITRACFTALATSTSDEERKELLDRVVGVNLRVAGAIAARYRGRGVPAEDLLQVARMALVMASQSFDPQRGYDFLTYAVPTIRGSVLKYFRDQGWMVRPPRRIRELQTRILQLSPHYDEELDVSMLAAALGEPVESVREALAARGCFQPDSIDAQLGEGTSTLADHLSSGDEEAFEWIDARMSAGVALRALDDRDKQLLRLRFFEGWSQQQIADEFGTSQVQVCRELRKILDRVRRLVGVGEARSG